MKRVNSGKELGYVDVSLTILAKKSLKSFRRQGVAFTHSVSKAMKRADGVHIQSGPCDYVNITNSICHAHLKNQHYCTDNSH